MPGGTFHVTIIDPMPITGRLGARLRTWMEENLLLNLERQFRCINPSKLFPIWLADASLRGEGSAITTAKYFAVPPNGGNDNASELSLDEKEAKTELRSVVGRMLWMEVWGSYVAADKWWWEIPEIVDECERLETYWEYSMVEAVKDA
jgi:hypothetical protein